jgi:signal peptidase II
MNKCLRLVVFCTSCLLFIGCDRVTKDLAKTHLKDKAPLSYFHDSFRLEYAENTGAALNLGDNLPKAASFWLLSIIPLLFLSVALFYTVKNLAQMSRLKIFSLACICSGGIGNIIDRILFDRHVTDFMNMGIGNLRTGIFNVADVLVTAGVIGLLLSFNNKNKMEPETIPVQ